MSIIMEGLNEKIWDSRGEIIPTVREKLLQISRRFLDDFITPIKIRNIFFTGSLASYQYTATSDIDVHITVDVQEEYSAKSTTDYFELKTDFFNKNHNIFVKGYKVELNIKPDEVEKQQFHKDKAVYDLLNNKWINKPNPNTRNLDDPIVLAFCSYFENQVNDLIKEKAPYYEFKKLKNNIKALRKRGLEYDGEYSIGNLIFKHLRNTRVNEKLFDFKNDLEDKELSLESFKRIYGY